MKAQQVIVGVLVTLIALFVWFRFIGPMVNRPQQSASWDKEAEYEPTIV